MYGLAVLSVALFAGQAAATAISARSPILSLLRRQSAADFDPSEIPPQCQSQCATISTALTSDSCTSDLSCLCSSDTSNGLYNCLECALSLDPDESIMIEAQDEYDQYAQACQSAGANVSDKTLTIPSGSSATGSQGSGSSGSATGGATPTSTSPADSGSKSTAAQQTDGAQETGSSSDPLKSINKTGAGVMTTVSSVGLAGAVGAMIIALAL
ncbi:hypothetical protein GY45DRAFT_1357300 [Cubamyces sp. BRFM 1775]|nr:hypothetical protein GY45DRAFT_1357300 [Cubamyces sp. BRFM 1775]